MTDDKVFEQAVAYLENDGELPKSVTNKFLAACLRELHHQATDNREKALRNERRVIRLEVLLGANGIGLIFGLLKFFGVI